MTKEMSYLEMVINERKELGRKIAALSVYIYTFYDYECLPEHEKKLLTRQLAAMRIYCNILEARITLYSES